ncbi:MAG TPA: efflux RND transporter periplasmic adaptor subunit [Candidatus Krumholzibacteria bacterium]|nr:efflux RND transporter periplasmic adaptor subunit [Candidatus Krumholzibacteria bacterium]
MNERRKKVLVPIVILAAGVIATAAMIASRKPAPQRPPESYAPLVRVVVAEPRATRLSVATHGTVEPRTETALVAEVAGRVLSIAPSFASGGFFAKGDVLLRIDPVDYELAVVASRSAVAQAKVRLEQEEAQAELAREEWKQLGSGEANTLATRELQLDEAKASLEAAEARLRQAERNLDRATVRAPFACRVRNKATDVGQYVNPGAALAHIYATDTAEVRLPIPDGDFAHLDLPMDFQGGSDGPRVRLRADLAGKQREWTARVVRVEGEIDPRTRMVYVVARVDDPYGRAAQEAGAPLAVGLFVEAEIEGRMIERAVVLPRTALRRGDIVLVVDDEGRIRFQPVEVLRTGSDEVVIGAGLSGGERICVSTIETVTDGMSVRTEDSSAVLPADTTTAPAEAAR